ncbi:MAG: hypothetical protein AB8I08_33565 [Sandaracinaceae bacterium]
MALPLAGACGATRAHGDTTCDSDGDCQSQLGDPPADASWRCVEHQCSARAAGPFEAELAPDEVEAEANAPEVDSESTPPPPPVGPGDRDVQCTTPADCMVLGPMPADASWVCIDGRCGLQGAGPFRAEDRAPQ